jgi:hypothetical protein
MNFVICRPAPASKEPGDFKRPFRPHVQILNAGGEAIYLPRNSWGPSIPFFPVSIMSNTSFW